MITGHFTTALVPYADNKKYPLFTLLVLTQVQDFLIPVDMMIQGIGLTGLGELEMTLSHDIVPALIFSILAYIGMSLIYKDRKLAFWGAGLVIFHEICDLVSGFSHHVMGESSLQLGTDYYRKNQPMAFLIEALLATVCLGYYVYRRKQQKDPIKMNNLIALVAIIYAPIALSLFLSLNGLLFT